MSGVTQALGFPSGAVTADVSTGASLLMNMKRPSVQTAASCGKVSCIKNIRRGIERSIGNARNWYVFRVRSGA